MRNWMWGDWMYGYGMGWGWFGPILMIVFWVLVICNLTAKMRNCNRQNEKSPEKGL